MPVKQRLKAQWEKCGAHACLPFWLWGICWCLHPHTGCVCSGIQDVNFFYEAQRGGLKLLFIQLNCVFIINCWSIMLSVIFTGNFGWCWDVMRDCTGHSAVLCADVTSCSFCQTSGEFNLYCYTIFRYIKFTLDKNPVDFQRTWSSYFAILTFDAWSTLSCSLHAC